MATHLSEALPLDYLLSAIPSLPRPLLAPRNTAGCERIYCYVLIPYDVRLSDNRLLAGGVYNDGTELALDQLFSNEMTRDFDTGRGENAPMWVFAEFIAVPEPSTWMMLILGFGMIGWRLRGGRAQLDSKPKKTRANT